MKFFIGFLMIIYMYSAKNSQYNKKYIANVFIDNVKVADYYVDNNRIVKAIYIDQSRNARGEIQYFYNGFGKLSEVKFKGQKDVIGSNSDLETKFFNDRVIQEKLVNEKLRIFIPLQIINTNELRDVSYLFSNATKYADIKKGIYREVSINNINKSFRFYPSDIEGFISTKNIIKTYKVTLKQDTIVKEEILFDKGLLTRTYVWKNTKKLMINIDCKSQNKESRSSLKVITLQYR
jgi:hypothetical protein